LAKLELFDPAAPDRLTLERDAASLAEALPEILVEAVRAAQSIAHGLHGRRRAGPGETFWQFRRFLDGEPSGRIDWRRSARDDLLYVREREWEAAHTVFVWADRSASMSLRSRLALASKRHRALVLALAMATLLIEGGERAALLGLTRPSASRRIAALFAEALARDSSPGENLPPPEPLPRFSEFLIIGDLLDPAEAIEARLARLAENGARGHLVMILDPAEEAFPFGGRAVFVEPESGQRWLAGRAENFRDGYRALLAAHKAALAALCARLGWSFLVHHTDRPAHEALISLRARLMEGGERRGRAS
jgi:uncharacterized protein (DUF58 family)